MKGPCDAPPPPPMDSPLGLAQLLHPWEPLPEVGVLGDAVVVGGQLEQFDLSDHLKLLERETFTPLDFKKVLLLLSTRNIYSFEFFLLIVAIKKESAAHLSSLLEVDQTALKKR